MILTNVCMTGDMKADVTVSMVFIYSLGVFKE